MPQTIEAVFEHGVLRPIGPHSLRENQCVRLIVAEPMPNTGVESLIDYECMDQCALEGDASITLEEVREALAKIPGSLTADFIAERDER